MRIFSGIQPTGRKHLGNYLGAIRQYVDGQHRGDPAIFCIVDLHAITVPYEPEVLRSNTLDLTALLLAAGLDPRPKEQGGSGCVLFRQSDVPAHTELTWLLTSVTAVGELDRMHQFRSKSSSARELASSGLLFYPVLMAADVLVYRAHEVPVGEDQREHLELMRDVARRANARFGEDLLVVPEQRIPQVGARIMDFQEPTRKMSTTGGTPQGTVLVLDEPKVIEKKLKRAVTDSDDPWEIRRDRAAKPGVTNLIDVIAASRGEDPDAVVASLADARGYGDLKLAAAAAITELLTPVRERYEALRADEDALEAILAESAARASAMAQRTLDDVRAAMGFGTRPAG